MIKRHFIGGETVIKMSAEKLSLDKEMITTGGDKGVNRQSNRTGEIRAIVGHGMCTNGKTSDD
jgi:hypothetical protein